MILDPLKKLSFGRKIASLAVSLYLIPSKIFKGGRIKYGKNFICKWDLKVKGPGKVVFEDNVNAWTNLEPNIIETFSKDAIVHIGEGTRLNGSQIQCRKSISIGKNCVLGSTILSDTEFHPMPGSKVIPTKPVAIKDNVWIGGRSAILKGVTVGEQSVIGLGSVVRKDIPPKSVVIGNPAQIVKTLK